MEKGNEKNAFAERLQKLTSEKEESLWQIVEEIAYRMDGNKNKKTVLKYLGLTKGWSMHDLVMAREEIKKYHPSKFWERKKKYETKS